MKFLRLTTITVLTATIFAGGISAFADGIAEVEGANPALNVETDGQIIFAPNTDEETIVQPPIDEPDVEIDPVPEGQTGPLTIAYAPTMDFGTQVISNQDIYYDMVAEMQQRTGTEGDEHKVPYVSFAQVQDTRGNNQGWELEVSLSKFESGTLNNELRGARLLFKAPTLDYKGNNEENAPAIHQAGMYLDADGGAMTVMSAGQDKGAGVSSVVWGDQAAITAQVNAGAEVVVNDGIQLWVPGATAKDAALYEATLTWNLTSTTDEAGESVPE